MLAETLEWAASVLGLAKGPSECSVDELRVAYKASALANHPDKGGDEEKFKSILNAYQKMLEFKKEKETNDEHPKKRKREEGPPVTRKSKSNPTHLFRNVRSMGRNDDPNEIDAITIALGIDRYLKTQEGRSDPLAKLLGYESVCMKACTSKRRGGLPLDEARADRLTREYIEGIREQFRVSGKDPRNFEHMTEWSKKHSLLAARRPRKTNT